MTLSAVVGRAALLCAVAGFAAPVAADELFSRATSPAGVPFWYLQRADALTTTLLAGFADGFPLAHPDKIGAPIVGSVLMRFGPKGSSAGDFDEQLKDVEARCGLSAAPMSTTFSVEAKPDDFGDALDLCFGFVTEPALREADLDKIRKSAVAGRERMMESREAIASLVMRRLTQADSPFSKWSEPKAIAAATPADIDQWRREVFARDNLTIVAVGAQDAAAVGALIDKSIGQLPEKSAPAPTTPPTPVFPAKTIVLEKDGDQTAVNMEGYLDLALGEGPIALVGANVLGGGLDRRLSKAVRGELGATYGISAGLGQITPRQRTFSIRTAMSNDLAAAGLKRIREVYDVWRRDGVTAEEVEPAREQLANGFDKSAASSSGKAYGLLSLLRGGANAEYEASYNDRLRKVDVDTVNALLKAKTPAALTTVIVASKADGLGADCVIHAIEEVDTCK